RAGALLYGVGTPMTLQQQNFQGTNDAYIFDVKTLRYVKVNSMNYARWYPTLAESGQLFFTGSNAGYGPATAAWRTPGFWNLKTNTFRPVPGIPDPQDL